MLEPKDTLFRRTLRIQRPTDEHSIDALLIRHMEQLESDSPHRLQEWMRNALRETYKNECLALVGAHGEQRQ